MLNESQQSNHKPPGCIIRGGTPGGPGWILGWGP